MNPLSYWLPVDALVVRIEIHKRTIYALSRVFYPILSEHPQIRLTLDNLPEHVDAVCDMFGNCLLIFSKVVPRVVGV